MKLSEARSNCTIPCSIQTQKAEEGEVTKALLCTDLRCVTKCYGKPMQNLRLDMLNGSAMRPQAATHGTAQTCWKLLGTEHTYSPDLASYFSCGSKSGHRKVIAIFYFPINMSLIIVASNRNSKASGTGSYISIWPVAPPKSMASRHLVLVVLFGALRIIPWQSKEFSWKILKVQRFNGPNDDHKW